MLKDQKSGVPPDDAWLQSSFCEKPWSFAEVHSSGDVFVCCPRFSANRRIGNIFTETPTKLWNSEAAKSFRGGILDGTFGLCHRTQCPSIAGRSLVAKSSVLDRYYRRVIDEHLVELVRGPRRVKLAHDDSCNLACPSCRAKVIGADQRRQVELAHVLNEFIVPFLSDCEVLSLSGDGDPFASRHYRDILQMTADKMPGMRIDLHTNGVLANEVNWSRLRLGGRVERINISIDAAEEITYDIVRPGRNWSRLTGNLEFLASLRRANKVKSLALSFVVQECNYGEMGSFVRLAQRMGADSVGFSLMYRWARAQTAEDYASTRIWGSSHPRYRDFLQSLQDPILADPMVFLGDVAPFRLVATGASTTRA